MPSEVEPVNALPPDGAELGTVTVKVVLPPVMMWQPPAWR